MRLTLRVFCATSSLVVALFFAKFASADTIPNPLLEIQNNISSVPPQIGSGSIVTYSVSNGSVSHNASKGSLETEDSFLPLSEEDYDDAFVLKAAAPAAPETRNFVLLGSGLLTAAGFIRRRKVAVQATE
ncbi:hypothetical protein RBB79_04945 [Tunturiibacter empetritectus]|uniref:PEP-CTERM sorting domain-containing protein n=2 Tax=Tunturiibacter TaxID=3154218 RepID=A0A852VH99_9BACT|nr:hypothetical protein [Edaphobacter lichenicola]NYF88866.1 hypothetical protein [Edaphobacter lichenicola]